MKSLEAMEDPMLHSLLKAYGDAYSAAINLRIPEYPRNESCFAERVSAPDKTPRRNHSWLKLLTAFF
jgi:hypothetical protein